MKKIITPLIVAVCIFTLVALRPRNLTDKDDIISLFNKKQEIFIEAVSSGNYETAEKVRGIHKITVYEAPDCVEFMCGGSGFGPSTHYYGFYYSEKDDLCAVFGGPELVEHGDGWLYEEEDGDNRYYVEPLGDHFFYYEAHF